jgi:hypothetical protein
MRHEYVRHFSTERRRSIGNPSHLVSRDARIDDHSLGIGNQQE